MSRNRPNLKRSRANKPRTAPFVGERFDTKQAAAYLGRSPRTLETWRLRRSSPIPYYRVGAERVVYLQGDLDAYLSARRVPADRPTAKPRAS